MKQIHGLNYKELSTKFTEKLNSVTIEQAAERLYPISRGGSMWMPSADDCNKANKQKGFIDGAEFMKKNNEKDMLDFAWFVVKNLGQYPNDEKAHFEGKYLEQFRNK